MKTSSRNRFFLCFRPIDFDPDDMEVDCSPKRVLSYISGTQKRDSSNLQRSDSENMNSRRSFSGTVKTVLFETSLGKKVRDRRERKLLRRSDSSKSDIQPQKSSKQKLRKYSSLRSEVCFLDALPPPNTPVSESPEPEILNSIVENPVKTDTEKMMRSFVMLKFMFLVIVSLWVTMFWGRLMAVLMTTIWFYFVRFCKSVKDRRRRRISDIDGTGRKSRGHDDVSDLSKGKDQVLHGNIS